MGRWEPEAPERLERAALELFLERGFDHVTVAEIAARAGLTARTFFRHFADKREVLFAGSADLQARLVQALEATPDPPTPMRAAAPPLAAAAAALGQPPEHSRQRQTIINANPEL